MKDDLKNQIREKAELVKEKAESAFTSIYEGVEAVEGRPNIAEDETLLIRVFEGKAYWYIFGLIITFIPPFVWGPVILLSTYYFGANSGVMVTDRRVVIFRKKLKPKMYAVVEIPIKHINEARRLPLTHSMESSGERMLGSSGIVIQWESTTEGTKSSVVPGIRSAKKVIKAIDGAMSRKKA